MMMVAFIASRIIQDGKRSIAEGREKYKAYFIYTRLYESQRAEVDAILRQEGYEGCIVSDDDVE